MGSSNFIDDCVGIYYKYCHPVLFGEINRPPIWPVIVTALIIFLATSELGSQNCENGYCNHYKNIHKTSIAAPESKKIDTLISRIKLNHTTVEWRRAIIISMILSLVILMLFYNGLPDGFDFFLVSTILFVVIYFSSTWLQWHWWKCRDFQIEEKLLDLRHLVKSGEIKSRQKQHQQYRLHYDSLYGSEFSSVMDKISSILD